MFCPYCGAQLKDGALVCEQCGATQFQQNGFGFQTANKMKKKDYFKSEISSPKSKKLIKANWVLFALHTVATIVTLGALLFSVVFVSNSANTIEENKELDKYFQELMEQSGLTMDDVRELGVGNTMAEVRDFVLKLTIILLSIYSVITIVLCFFAVYTKNIVVSVISAVVCYLFGGIITLGFTAAIAIMTYMLDKEYKNYFRYGTENNFY